MRAGDAAEAGQVLISDAVRDRLEPADYRFGQARPLEAPGAPDGLAVCAVRPR